MQLLRKTRASLLLVAMAAASCGELSSADEPPTDSSLLASEAEAGDGDALEVKTVSAQADSALPGVIIEKVKLGKLTFDVRTAGPKSGDPVLLLHGFPETSYEWRHQIRALSQAGYRVIAPDLRGYSPGARPDGVDQYNLLLFVADVLAIADWAGAKRFHLVGHDVGAMVAWGTAQLTSLTRLKSLTILSVSHPAIFAAQLKKHESCQAKASAWYADVVKPGSAEKLLSGEDPLLVDVWSQKDADARAEYERVLGTPDALDATIDLWRANIDGDVVKNAFPIAVAVPTLFMIGDKDPFNCVDAAQLSRSYVLGSFNLQVFAGADHWLPEEEPERVNALLLSHLRRNRR